MGYGLFSKGLEAEFERAVVNEPSVFEPLKFYCTFTEGTTDYLYFNDNAFCGNYESVCENIYQNAKQL